MKRHYVALDETMASPRLSRLCGSLVGCLAAIFDLPAPLIVFIEPAPPTESESDVHVAERDLDVNVRAAITRNAANTIWAVQGPEDEVVRAVAHEVGHIAELLGYVDERLNIEEFPQQLANAVSTTYATGVGWIDRLLSSNFYFRALADRRFSRPREAGWGRADYWHRLARTRGGYGFLGDPLAPDERARLASAWRMALDSRTRYGADARDTGPTLFPVPREGEPTIRSDERRA